MLLLSTAALADTTFYQQNIPGTSLPSATKGGYAVQMLGGQTQVYTTAPGSAHLREVMAPSYTVTTTPGGATHYQENIPGTPLPSATRGGYTVEEIGGQTQVYRTAPGSAHLRDPLGPSYTVTNPRQYDAPWPGDGESSEER